jgi:hypothetical protein
MASLLNNGKQQFIDLLGRPLAGAKVYFYTPGTEAKKDTWQDAAKTIPNTNPVTLDVRGQAVIYGDGIYRQVLKDRLGVTIWDQLVEDLSAGLDATAAGLVEDLREGLSDGSGGELVGFQQTGSVIKRSLDEKLRDTVSTKDFGLLPGEAADAALLAITAEHDVFAIEPGTYPLTSATSSGSANKTIKGIPGLTIFDAPAGSAVNMLSYFDANNLHVSGLKFRQNKSSITQAGSALVLRDANNVVVEDVRVEGLGGLGNGILQYNSETAPGSGVYIKTERIVYRNIDVIGNRAISDNVNGAIIVDAYWSRLHGIYAQGIEDFPAEFKNDCKYGLLSDVQIRDSRNGLYHGSQTADHPSYIASSNVVVRGADFGVYTGYGVHNTYSNILVDSTGSTYGTPETARLDGSKSSIWSLHSAGAVNTYGVRYNGTASDNYVAINAQHTNINIVTMKAGATRNVTEIVHPGARNNLLTGSPIANETGVSSGPLSNPVYCHATGQYFGSLSDTWEWRLSAPPASSPIGADIWRHSVAGQNGFVSLLGSDGFQHGLSVNTPSGRKYVQYTEAADHWELKGKTTAYRADATSFSARTDNVINLGSSSFRWGQVYAGSGTINTSDEREKEDIAAIDEAAIRAVRKISFKQFRFRDAVMRKGSAARVHFGVIAQEVKAAFESEGVDPFKYGVLCYDEWEDEFEPVIGTRELEQAAENGEMVPVSEDYETGEMKLVRAAGNRYGVRYEELMCLKLASL